MPPGPRSPIISLSPFMVQHLHDAARALEGCVPLEGYVYWTLLDDFEWAERYEPRFGLYAVDRRRGANLASISTPIVPVLKRITAEIALPAGQSCGTARARARQAAGSGAGRQPRR